MGIKKWYVLLVYTDLVLHSLNTRYWAGDWHLVHPYR